MSSAKWQLFSPGFNVLSDDSQICVDICLSVYLSSFSNAVVSILDQINIRLAVPVHSASVSLIK